MANFLLTIIVEGIKISLNKSIKTGKQDQPDIVRGAQVQAYLDACERSAETGNWENVLAWV